MENAGWLGTLPVDENHPRISCILYKFAVLVTSKADGCLAHDSTTHCRKTIQGIEQHTSNEWCTDKPMKMWVLTCTGQAHKQLLMIAGIRATMATGQRIIAGK
jgi:hypothetical protein